MSVVPPEKPWLIQMRLRVGAISIRKSNGPFGRLGRVPLPKRGERSRVVVCFVVPFVEQVELSSFWSRSYFANASLRLSPWRAQMNMSLFLPFYRLRAERGGAANSLDSDIATTLPNAEDEPSWLKLGKQSQISAAWPPSREVIFSPPTRPANMIRVKRRSPCSTKALQTAL